MRPAASVVCCTPLAEGLGEVLAQLSVLLGKVPDALLRRLEPPQQGSVRGALPGRHR